MLDEIRAQVRRIARGRVMTYGEVAEKAGYPGAARQVVWALRNSGPAVPWHRVVGAGLRIRLPGEAGMEQQIRLASEGWTINAGRLISRTSVRSRRP
jgi:methylated-DNA-protein-cysteine methyltransferase related protein